MEVPPLAARLRYLRGSMTQMDLGLELGVSSPLISSWETGQCVPPTTRLMQYSTLFRPDHASVLLTELLGLREAAVPVVRMPELTIRDILIDLRAMLEEIRDRLPPQDQEG